ncbi:unnamed protein product, partial [Cyprideis torosa]
MDHEPFGVSLDLWPTHQGATVSTSAPSQEANSISYCEQLTGVVYALDFSPWKRPIVRRFLSRADVRFVAASDKLPKGSTLVIWGRKAVPDGFTDCNIVRLEDGFIRSVGLGADLIQPVSWVADSRGIYYDSGKESDLEYLLASEPFDHALMARATSLRHAIVASRITKYNVGSGGWQRPSQTPRVILVPGQVEDDASIRYGAPGICKNIDLLKAVQAANPNAYVVYKPHPDVVAGLRKQGESEASAEDFCDEMVIDTPMDDMLDAVDEVHLMTSLTGFEALVRGRKVVCYGQPFYAGWGLTDDMIPLQRRQRRLTLDQLVAGALILYPSYINQATGNYTTPEE